MLIEWLFPKKCVGCKTSGFYFCPQCANLAKPHFPQVCPVCEKPSIDGLTHKYCQNTIFPNGMFCCWVYEGTIRKLIWKLKYKFISDMAQELAQRLVENFETAGIPWLTKDQ